MSSICTSCRSLGHTIVSKFSSCLPAKKQKSSLDLLPDTVLGLIGNYVENPFQYLRASKRIGKQAPIALRDHNELIGALLKKGNEDFACLKRGFLKTKGWQHTITALHLENEVNGRKINTMVFLFPRIERCTLSGHSNDNALKSLVKLKQLRELTLHGIKGKSPSSNVQRQDFQEIAKIKTLRKLHFSCTHNRLTRVDIGYLRHLKLDEFLIFGGELTNGALREIGNMKTLKKLSLGLCKDQINMKFLSNLNLLEELELSYTYIKGERHLVKFTNLRKLNVDRSKCSDELMKQVSQIPTMEELHLENSRGITQVGYHYLQHLPNLKVEFDSDKMYEIRYEDLTSKPFIDAYKKYRGMFGKVVDVFSRINSSRAFS